MCVRFTSTASSFEIVLGLCSWNTRNEKRDGAVFLSLIGSVVPACENMYEIALHVVC